MGDGGIRALRAAECSPLRRHDDAGVGEGVAPRMEPFNVFMGPDVPPITPREELAIDLELSDELLDVKMDAIRAHESQVEGMMAVIGPEGFRRFMRGEYFRLAAEKPSVVA